MIMNVKRWLCACCVMLVLVPAAVADKYDDLGMINVVATDANNLTWELLDSIYYSTRSKLTREVSRLMNSGRYIESVAPVVGQGALIVHRPNTQNVKQTFAMAISSRPYLMKDIKKKFKDGFSVKFLCVDSRMTDAYIVYDRNPQVTKQAFPNKHFEKYTAEGYYLRPLFTYDYTFAQNGQPGGAVVQMDKGYYSTQGATAERLMKDIGTYKDEGWLLSSVTMYNDSYRAFFDKNPLADRQTTLIFSSLDEVKDFIASGITTNLKVTTQWLTTTSLGRQQAAERKAELQNSGSGWGDALGYFGKAILSGAQMVNQIKGVGGSSTTTAGTTTVPSATTSSATKKTKTVTPQKNKTQANFVAYKNYDRAYDGYETQLIKMRSDGKYDPAEVRDIQRKMKDIRAKIAALGYTRAVSDVESWKP